MSDFSGFGGAVAFDRADGTVSVMVRIWNKRRSEAHQDALAVRDFIVPAPVRLASALASAAIVRDVAALGAVVVFGTMLAVVLGGGPA